MIQGTWCFCGDSLCRSKIGGLFTETWLMICRFLSFLTYRTTEYIVSTLARYQDHPKLPIYSVDNVLEH